MGTRARIWLCIVGVLIALPLAAATAVSASDLDALKALYRRPAEPPPIPPDNPSSHAKVRLGWTLFQDRRLSIDASRACIDCHRPEMDWQDGLPRALGMGGVELRRRTPSLYDAAWGETFFWDGRASSLEAQALMPIEAPDEMNMPLDDLVRRLEGIAFYRGLFVEAFPDDPAITPAKIGQAIAAFERTIVSGTMPFDRWIEGDATAIGPAAQRGFLLFNGKANCAICHSGWRLTDDGFHDIGLPTDDPGRGPIIAVPQLDHAFKTPSLRNVARRPHFMHDGSMSSLRAVVDHYADGVITRPTLSDDLKPITLTEAERDDLVAFLETLKDEGPPDARWSPYR
ncbi:MAG TPA: cytochrome c peroxidase [Alphaproteobacteria bacterium]